MGIALASNFLTGAAGSALEQKLGTGNVDLWESITGGLVNAVNGAIYGNDKLKDVGQVFWRGGAAGAATSGLNYLSRVLDPRGTRKRTPGHGNMVSHMQGAATRKGCAAHPAHLQEA